MNDLTLNKCIGIVSYFPDGATRTKRIGRFNNLLKQISEIWPTIDIVIIAQNWQDYKLPEISNKIVIDYYNEPLTIVGARNALRAKFLASNYNYLIMLDDDAIIHIDSQAAANAYLKALDDNPDKFCFIHSKDHWHKCDDYIKAPLNLCAFSKTAYALEEMPSLYLEKAEALEDDAFAVLMHIKHPEYEFLPPEGIYCTHHITGQYFMQFANPNVAPSTWCKNPVLFPKIVQNTILVIDYIIEHKDLDTEAVKNIPGWR